MFLPRKVLEAKLRNLVAEDLGQGDLTTYTAIPPNRIVEAEITMNEGGIVAGIEESMIFLESFQLKGEALVKDGEKVKEKTIILKIVGDARTILSVERTLLNILSRMSGVASHTRSLVSKLRRRGHKALVACTRKTAPGMLYFDKKAVMLGGGDTHRLHLDDLILLKDNHISVIGDLSRAVRKVKNSVSFTKKVEVEVGTSRDAVKAAKSGADIVMLDNFTPKMIREAISMLEKEGLRKKILVEASGGVNEANIERYAATGVDVVSVGEITDSVKCLDLSLQIVGVPKF